jgi:4-aminobutyrate aminotransferase-like enzyme
VPLPRDYLKEVYREVREIGGVCVADEVQVGFGRVGTHFWGFEQQDVVPDIVTMGKPIGNGHPMAAVVTTRPIADAFNNGMEYFNTFGGNPVSCAVGLAVLDVIEKEGLQQHAHELGNWLLENLNQLKNEFACVGDVRGSGLFLGIEFVLDHEDLTPATGLASAVVERMKDRRILLSTDGPFENVIKFKPPMVFSRGDAERLVMTLRETLNELVP